MLGTDGANLLGILGEAAGALNLLISQLSRRSTLGTALGQERVLLIGFSTDGVEMHGLIIMRGEVMDTKSDDCADATLLSTWYQGLV